MSDLLIQKYLRFFDTLPSAPDLGDVGILLNVNGNTAILYMCFTAGNWSAIASGSGPGAVVSFDEVGAGTNVNALVASNLTAALKASSFIIVDTAVADGDLAANQVALFFDPTNGAGKLKIKGKTADGTVVAGEVALT